MVEYSRRTARVVLINDDDLVLLVDSNFDTSNPDARHGWFTPGGGVAEGEDLAAAAVRELFEETGLRLTADELGAHVAFSSTAPDPGWVGHVRDDFFMCRVTKHEVDVAGMLDYEIANLRGVRWWSVDEMASTTDQIIPGDLAGLVRRLLDGDIPAEPAELNWYG